MKVAKLLMFAVVISLFSLAASAQTNVIFTNNDGTFAFDENPSDATYDELTLGMIGNGLGASGELTAISGLSGFGIPDASTVFPGCAPVCLGSISLNTGTMVSGGSILGNATFNPGGNFTVTYTNGVQFTGTFTTASWSEIGTNIWAFTGTITNGTLIIDGTDYTISTAATIQLTTVNGQVAVYHKNKETYTFQDSGGTTNFAVTPEPGSLALFGSGLIVVGLITRRRLTTKGTTSQG